jgi:hypothetical protein
VGRAGLLPDGHKARSISEDDPALPGAVSWREICCLPDDRGEFGYNNADGFGSHIYCYGWDGPVDELRFKFTLKWHCSLGHKPIWIDEVGIGNGATALEKMRAYIEIAQILVSEPIGRRVMMLCPFVSNGDPGVPPAWDPRYLMRDPACYTELGRWMLSP